MPAFRPLVFALLLASAASFAQDTDTPAARRSAAEALVATLNELSGPERMKGVMRQAMVAPLEQALAQDVRLNPAQRQRAAQVLGDEMAKALDEQMRDLMPPLYAAMTDIYVERFSLAEIQELQRFYAGGTGRKAMEIMVTDMPRLMQPMSARMQSQAGALQARVGAAIERLRAEGIDLAPAKR